MFVLHWTRFLSRKVIKIRFSGCFIIKWVFVSVRSFRHTEEQGRAWRTTLSIFDCGVSKESEDILAVIIGNGLVALSSVANGVKMNSTVYIEFLRMNFQSLLSEKYWLSNRMWYLCTTIPPAHTAIATAEFSTELRFKMSGHPVSRDLTLIEIVWASLRGPLMRVTDNFHPKKNFGKLY